MNNDSSNHDLWVFGYGSLMWNPGFPYIEDIPGKIDGFHRSLCVTSTHYRGTDEHPGLVLGLDLGGSCEGRAFRVSASEVDQAIVYLDDREQVTQVYTRQAIAITLTDGRTVGGITYVVRHDHHQYTKLPIAAQAARIAQGVGERGTALEYLANTMEQINDLGIYEDDLSQVLSLAKNRT